MPLLAACSNRLALLVANDSGMPHISAAAGTPTLSLFTSPRADTFAPVGPHTSTVAATTELTDKPMEALAVDTVLSAAIKLLQ
jgi:ADP-heptose:LPS heptosyltransferase